jgi:hypothetical protein
MLLLSAVLSSAKTNWCGRLPFNHSVRFDAVSVPELDQHSGVLFMFLCGLMVMTVFQTAKCVGLDCQAQKITVQAIQSRRRPRGKSVANSIVGRWPERVTFSQVAAVQH